MTVNRWYVSQLRYVLKINDAVQFEIVKVPRRTNFPAGKLMRCDSFYFLGDKDLARKMRDIVINADERVYMTKR